MATMRRAVAIRLLVFAAVAAACFWRLGATPLNETDEGFTANRAASLIRHHAFLVTYDDLTSDEPQFHKPPLWYWIVAACYRVLGVNEWAFRLPTAAASFLLCALLYRIYRRFFDEPVALAGAALLCAVPFVLFHMRTAMLDLPVLLLSLLALWTFAYDERRVRASVCSALLCGAVFLIKGPPGLVAIGVCLAYAALVRPLDRMFLRDAAVHLAVALLLPLLYFAALPGAYRHTAERAFFLREVSGRLTARNVAHRLAVSNHELLQNVRWHAPAAALGLLLVLARIRERTMREWLSFCAVVCLPVYLISSRLLVPYPRYLLPLYPCIVALGACFAFAAARSRRAAWLLPPFAAAGFLLEPSALRWIPAAAALAVFAAHRVPALSARAWVPTAAACVLLASTAVPSALSTAAWRNLAHETRNNRPQLIPLARAAGRLVPEHERLIVGHHFKKHATLFYSRRALQPMDAWLLSDFTPGATRYGIFVTPPPPLPHVAVETVREIDDARLLRLTVLPDATNVLALVAGTPPELAARAETLRLLALPFERHPGMLVVRRVSPPNEAPLEDVTLRTHEGAAPKDGLRLGQVSMITVTLPGEQALSSIAVVPLSRRDALKGILLEAQDAASGAWRPVAAVRAEPDAGLAWENGRLVRARRRALYIRLGGVRTSRLRLSKPEGRATLLADVKLFVTAPPP